MNDKFPIASTAALIAEPARSAMLLTLLGGRALAAGELARAANVSAQSASMHLSQLLQGGLVEVAQDGRHRYYRIASPEVAHAIEALGVISTRPRPYHLPAKNEAIRYARTCYDHLAGELAVKLTDAFVRKRLLVPRGERDYEITVRGEELLAEWRIDIEGLRRMRRSFAHRCLDWTERRDHLAGAVGAAVCQKLLDSRWIIRERNSRAVQVTSTGRRNLEALIASN
ncbi:MAG TPA: helix-turn-helix domain-containing protein [Candidatus Angelobacter sp.]|jgi:DNA-binding transcriptional ArsR family regulator|nr:helix-turn-helix domain-containing protein [Candidatus Angelobacter sp.]